MPPPMPPPPAPPINPYLISGIVHYEGAAKAGVTVTVDNTTTAGTAYVVTTAADGSFVVNIANISNWNDGDTITILFDYLTATGRKITTVDLASFPSGEDIGVFELESIAKKDTFFFYENLTHRRIIPGTTFTISGTVYSNTGVVMSDVIVSLYRVSPAPRQNLPNDTTQTDSNGNYTLTGITGPAVAGRTYVVTAQKHGYMLGWEEVVLSGADETKNIIISELDLEDETEGIYNIHGHIYKFYKYSDTEDDTWHYVEGILLLGDLYNSAESGVSPTPEAQGYIEALSVDTTIELIEMESLGTQGLFDDSDMTLPTQTSDTRIDFDAAIPQRDFEAFAFKAKFPVGVEGIIELVLNGVNWFCGPPHNPGGTTSSRGVSLHGTALDSDGNPVDSATVTVYIAGTNIQVGTATTTPDGYYVVPGLSPDTEYDVYVTADNYGSSSGTFTTPPTPSEGGTPNVWEGGMCVSGCSPYPIPWYLFGIYFIFSPLVYSTHKVYGKVYHRRKGLAYGIADFLVLSTDAATGDVYAALSDVNGDYEIYLPAALDYDVFALKRRYHIPRLQRGAVSADLEVNIPVMPIKRPPEYAKVGGRIIAR